MFSWDLQEKYLSFTYLICFRVYFKSVATILLSPNNKNKFEEIPIYVVLQMLRMGYAAGVILYCCENVITVHCFWYVLTFVRDVVECIVDLHNYYSLI